MNVKNFFSKNRESLQLIYGVFLIVLIPVLIAINAIITISSYNDNIDVSIQRQAQAIGRTINTLLKDDINNYELIQGKIEKLALANPDDFQNIEILIPDNDNFKIVASLEKDNINKTLDFYYYSLAWKLKENESLATDSLRLANTEEGKRIVKDLYSDDRFWLITMPMTDEAGNKQAILSIKLSSKIIDDLTTTTTNNSIYILIAIILIVILFLSITVKLWDYVLLY
ncbi:MAG: hypothetical protein KAS78_00160, partial [Candidatus Pacebacteria bacterium]|nr:hypothetical protein [Candidatus Paceibacterota bacterium]